MAAKYNPPPPGAIAWEITEFCFLGRFGRDKCYDLIKKGELAVVKIGKRTLVPAHVGRRWLEAHGLEVAA